MYETAVKASSEPTTHVACDRAEKEATRLKEVYQQLKDRLGPVLRNIPVGRMAAENQNGSDASLIAKRVGSIAEDVGTVVDDMQDLISRLDV